MLSNMFLTVSQPKQSQISFQMDTTRGNVLNFFLQAITLLREQGRISSANHYVQTMHSLQTYQGHDNLCFTDITSSFIIGYEAWMKTRRLCRNTTSFYMRTLRAVYNQAVREGLTADVQPFRGVYTGIDKTSKRALDLADLKRIKSLDLSHNPRLDFARDLFLLAFYLRGISFIDLAFLRKSDLQNGYITYCRRKTSRPLSIRWEAEMQQLLDKHPVSQTGYLLPIIKEENGSEYKQYRNQAQSINRQLKEIAKLLQLSMPLTMYVARHSWASIARSQDIPIAVISEAMGHDSEQTTQIYLNSILIDRIDEANSSILHLL